MGTKRKFHVLVYYKTVVLNWWRLGSHISFPYNEVAAQIYYTKIKTLTHSLSRPINTFLK